MFDTTSGGRRASLVGLVGLAAAATTLTLAAGASATPGGHGHDDDHDHGSHGSTTTAPYLVGTARGVTLTSFLTAGDYVGDYQFAGTPDGLGAYDNGNGTFTLLVGHEFNNAEGVTRAHGGNGSFVTKLIVKKANLRVLSAEDLATTLVTSGSLVLNRLCSATSRLPRRSSTPGRDVATTVRSSWTVRRLRVVAPSLTS